jgi:hypothetical protein
VIATLSIAKTLRIWGKVLKRRNKTRPART